MDSTYEDDPCQNKLFLNYSLMQFKILGPRYVTRSTITILAPKQIRDYFSYEFGILKNSQSQTFQIKFDD